MGRKKSKVSRGSKVVMSELEEILIACPGMSLDEARAMPRVSEEIREASRVRPGAIGDVRRAPSPEFVPIPKRETRVSSSSADHRLRLSSSSSDSKAMKAFLANGGEIEIIPTRNAKGFTRSNKVRVSGGFRSPRDASRNAHNKMMPERSSRS